MTRSGRRLLGPVSWKIERGGHCAVIGRNGAGKSTLLKVVRGELAPDSGGERVYDFGGGPQHSVLGLRQRMGLVSADMQEFYRLHAPRVPGRDMVLAGFFDDPLLYQEPTPEMLGEADRVLTDLGLTDLARHELGSLSTGQVRKLLVARALVTKPEILMLDEALDGLDVSSRKEVLELLDLAGKQSTLVCAAHRVGDLPDCVSRTIVVDHGKVLAEGDRDTAIQALRASAPHLAACDLPETPTPRSYDYLLRMEHVSVVVDGERLLHDINWQMLPGENWMVLGSNGAGKSTLLKVITSILPPYADDDLGVGVVERLGGMIMDEARPRIGVISPEFQTFYGRELAWEVTALETVLSGYRGSVGMLDEPTSRELLGAHQWLRAVGLEDLADRPLRRMSFGQQRRVLLARAMAPGPDLLLLDEPLSGLDSDSRAAMGLIIQKLAEEGVPMIMVTHHHGDWVSAFNRTMVLEHGRQIFCGTREEYEQSVITE